MLAFDAFVAWVGGIDQVRGADGGGAVGFFPGDKIDACGVLEVAPHAIVDAGLVPDVEDFAALGCVVAEGGGGGALDDGEVVGAFFSIVGHAQIDVPEVVGAHVQAEEMAGGIALAGGGGRLGIEGGGVVVVTVASIDVVAGKFLECGKRVGEFGGHRAPEQLIEGG